MKKLFVIVFLVIMSYSLCSQTVAWVAGGIGGGEYVYDEVSLRNTPLFNANEIKTKNIRGCTIIRSPGWNNTPDTLYIFDFDESGNIKREIRFRSWMTDNKDTIYWPVSELKHFSRIDSTKENKNGQTIITKYYVWAFNDETQEIDTSYIKKFIYDDRNMLMEFKMNGTRDFLEYARCGTGITYHQKYRYDEKKRIIYYHDLYSRDYLVIEHQKNRCLFRTYDSTTNKLVRKDVMHLKINDKALTENDGLFTIKLTRLNKGSRLFSQISNKQNGKRMTPDEYLLIYDYFDRPQSPTDPIVKAK